MKSFFVFIFLSAFITVTGQQKVIDLLKTYNNPVILIQFNKGSTNNYEVFIKNFLEKQGFKPIIKYQPDSTTKYDFKILYKDGCFKNNCTRGLGIWLFEHSNPQNKFYEKYSNSYGFKKGNCIKVTEKLMSKLLDIEFVKDNKNWSLQNIKLKKAVFLKVDSASYVLKIVRKKIKVKNIEPLFLNYAHKLSNQENINYYYEYGDAIVRTRVVYTVNMIPVGSEEKVIKYIRIYGSVNTDPSAKQDTKLKEIPYKHSTYIDKLLFGY